MMSVQAQVYMQIAEPLLRVRGTSVFLGELSSGKDNPGAPKYSHFQGNLDGVKGAVKEKDVNKLKQILPAYFDDLKKIYNFFGGKKEHLDKFKQLDPNSENYFDSFSKIKDGQEIGGFVAALDFLYQFPEKKAELEKYIKEKGFLGLQGKNFDDIQKLIKPEPAGPNYIKFSQPNFLCPKCRKNHTLEITEETLKEFFPKLPTDSLYKLAVPCPDNANIRVIINFDLNYKLNRQGPPVAIPLLSLDTLKGPDAKPDQAQKAETSHEPIPVINPADQDQKPRTPTNKVKNDLNTDTKTEKPAGDGEKKFSDIIAGFPIPGTSANNGGNNE